MKRSQTILMTILAAGLASAADTGSACRKTISTDAKAVSADLAVIAAQANAQGFSTAVEQFASDMAVILPTLNAPSQAAVEKFVTDLENATSASSPMGTAISPGEQLVLTSDWVAIVTSTGVTSAELTTITNDLAAVLATLNGISTAQLQTDLNTLLVDAQACSIKQ